MVMTANLSVRGNVIDDTGGPLAAGPSPGYLPGPLTGADGSRRQRGDPMSAQTYEWYIETTSSRRGDLVVGPWQDELAEPVVVIDRRELMAGRPSATARRKSLHNRFWDAAVLATIAVMIVGVILALGRIGQMWQGDPASGHEDHMGVVQVDAHQPGAPSDARSGRSLTDIRRTTTRSPEWISGDIPSSRTMITACSP